ncbi:MAG: HAMP domain-containing protein [Nitriliruptorales bacterium]|nr:HAMP domain-containing protein [Nitriliruptorales bacterium]
MTAEVDQRDGQRDGSLGTDFLDGLMLARYRRLGPRYIDWYLRVAYVFSAATVALAIVLFMGFVVDRPDVAWAAATLPVVWNLVYGEAVMVPVLRRTARPLRDWLAGQRDEDSTRAAWQVARRLTFLLGRQAFFLAFLGVSMPSVVYLRLAYDITLPEMGFAVLGVISFGTWLLFIGVLVGESWLRWPRRDVTAHLGSFADDEREVRAPIARKLLVMFHLVSLLTGAFVGVSASAGGADTADLVVMILLTGVFTFTTGGLLAWLMTRSVVAPVTDLVEATRRVREGEVGTRAPVTSNDEIGRLAVAINRMLDTLGEVDAAVRESSVRVVRSADSERQRIERAIRDGASHELLQVEERLSALLGASDDVVVEEIDATIDDLMATLDGLRTLARELNPIALETDGLQVALDRFAERSRLDIDVRVSTNALDERHAVSAWIVTTEVLAAIARDVSASSCRVEIEADGNELRISVRGDGKAMGALAADTGFLAACDRVEALGGSFVMRPRTEGGREFLATLPQRMLAEAVP